ncbi:mitochondrial large subunit ribosomal protein-domain-containing protein [Daldinia sp. FL1419]|nr:mitochondrial large subunit ribosomal protein-domain-containing protein [Daldinia sp. FL1419]
MQLLTRTLRHLAARPALLSTPLVRFALPIRTRCLSMSTSTPVGESPSLSEPIPPVPPIPNHTAPSTAPSTTETEQAGPDSEPKVLPYHVSRNKLNNLAVYHKAKRGGNLKITMLKRGKGDLQALKHDIQEALRLKEGDISVHNLTGHIILRGHMKQQVLNFLHTMGF